MGLPRHCTTFVKKGFHDSSVTNLCDNDTYSVKEQPIAASINSIKVMN